MYSLDAKGHGPLLLCGTLRVHCFHTSGVRYSTNSQTTGPRHQLISSAPAPAVNQSGWVFCAHLVYFSSCKNVVLWLSLSWVWWLLWWGDRGLWRTPLWVKPQKTPSLLFFSSFFLPACHSLHLGPVVSPCGRAVVKCNWLVTSILRCCCTAQPLEGSKAQEAKRRLVFVSFFNTRGTRGGICAGMMYLWV